MGTLIFKRTRGVWRFRLFGYESRGYPSRRAPDGFDEGLLECLAAAQLFNQRGGVA